MARAAIMMRKWQGRLVPADAYAEQQIDDIPDGKDLSVRVSVMSSTGKTHREGARGLFFGGIDLLSKNTDDPQYDSKDKAYETILRKIGYVRPKFMTGNRVEYVPVSTAEDAMPDEEFDILMERALAFVEETFGWDPWGSWKAEKDAERALQQQQRSRR